MADDSDETEGRRLYRAWADALAKSQLAMARCKVKLTPAEQEELKSLPPGTDRDPEYLLQRMEHPDE